MKFIIITSQRSGSNFLRRSLDSHPQVTCDGELLIGGNIEPPAIFINSRLPAKIYRYILATAWNPIGILENFMSRNDSGVVGFKAMYNHLAKPGVRKFLRAHKDIRIIHLRRDNLLKQYVSKALLSKKRDQPWQPHSKKKLPTVSTYITPLAAIKAMRQAKKQFEDFERLLSNHQKIELVYEQMIDGKCLSDQTTNAICSLLNLAHRPMCCDFVKVNPNELHLMIDNYEEVVGALQGTQFEGFLD